MKNRLSLLLALALVAACAVAYAPHSPALEIGLGVATGTIADAGDRALAARAERHFQRAVALAPDDAAAHTYYGEWLLRHGREADAVLQLKMAVVLDPKLLRPRDLLIQAETAAGDFGAARHAAMDTLTQVPDDAVALRALPHPPTRDAAYWIRLSGKQYRQGQYPRAIDAARKAIALEPENAEAYNNLGAASAALGQWDEAIRSEERAIALKPDFQLARNNLLWSLAQKAAHRSAGE
ncbi:MAG TPA: tetratricopeptide repeat protein [Opitutaceae bacterium]